MSGWPQALFVHGRETSRADVKRADAVSLVAVGNGSKNCLIGVKPRQKVTCSRDPVSLRSEISETKLRDRD